MRLQDMPGHGSTGSLDVPPQPSLQHLPFTSVLAYFKKSQMKLGSTKEPDTTNRRLLHKTDVQGISLRSPSTSFG